MNLTCKIETVQFCIIVIKNIFKRVVADLLLVFSHNNVILQQINAKINHHVSGTGIWTHYVDLTCKIETVQFCIIVIKIFLNRVVPDLFFISFHSFRCCILSQRESTRFGVQQLELRKS